MPKISLVDDDYAMEILAEHLGYRGYEARRIASAVDAFNAIEDIANSDLVILDIIMPREDPADRGIRGDITTGMGILKKLRIINPKVRVLVYTATTDSGLIAALKNTPNVEFLSKWSSPSLDEFHRKIDGMVGFRSQGDTPKAFIVHGQDVTEKLALKNFLQNTLRLSEPIILHEQPSLGRTLIEKFEDYAHTADLVFVLLTPDDKMAPVAGSNDEKRRARQNVIFELGYFLGVIGRRSGRVVLLYKGPLDLPSDLAGVVYVDISRGVEAAGEDIRRELEHVLGR